MVKYLKVAVSHAKSSGRKGKRADGQSSQQLRVSTQVGYEERFLLQGAVLHCTAARGGGVTIPGGVPEPWRRGTEGRGHSWGGLDSVI